MEQQKNEILKKCYLPEISLVFGILAFVPSLGVIFGFIAVVLGVIGILKDKKGIIIRKKFAYAGIVLGIVGAVFSIIIFFICFMAICTAGFLDINLEGLYLMIMKLISYVF